MIASQRRRRTRPTRKTNIERQLAKRFREMVRSLGAIDRDEEIYGYHDEPRDPGSRDRRAAIAALDVIQDFLSAFRQISVALYQLRLALREMERSGHTRLLLKPTLITGRKLDSRALEMMKAALAGIAYVKMATGMSRDQAATWCARKIPTALAGRISPKPINKSTIQGWMYKYGCSAKIRKEITATIGKSEEFRGLLQAKYRSKQMQGSFGEWQCLTVIWQGLTSIEERHPLEFDKIFELLADEYSAEALADRPFPISKK